MIVGVLTLLLAWCLHGYLNAVLFKRFRKKNRELKALRWAVSGLLVLVISWLVDLADFSDALDGKADAVDRFLFASLGFLAPLYAWGMFTIWTYEDTIDTDLADAKETAKLSRRTLQYIIRETQRENAQVNAIRKLLALKWARVLTAFGATKCPLIETALAPRDQIRDLVLALHDFLAKYYGEGLEEGSQLRVVYFEPIDGYLRAVVAWDGQMPGCVASPNDARVVETHFKVTDANEVRSLASWCAWHGRHLPIIIPDTTDDTDIARRGLVFEFFNEEQRNRVRSIAAYACRASRNEPGACPVIVLDSDQAGFFANTPAMTRRLRRTLEDFAIRLRYERDLLRLSERIASAKGKPKR